MKTSRYAVASFAVSFACLFQAFQTGQHWLVVTGLIFCMVAVALAVKGWVRQP